MCPYLGRRQHLNTASLNKDNQIISRRIVQIFFLLQHTSCPDVGICRKGHSMKNIEVFSEEAERISELADKHECCEASVVEALFEILEENGIDIEEAW